MPCEISIPQSEENIVEQSQLIPLISLLQKEENRDAWPAILLALAQKAYQLEQELSAEKKENSDLKRIQKDLEEHIQQKQTSVKNLKEDLKKSERKCEELIRRSVIRPTPPLAKPYTSVNDSNDEELPARLTADDRVPVRVTPPDAPDSFMFSEYCFTPKAIF